MFKYKLLFLLFLQQVSVKCCAIIYDVTICPSTPESLFFNLRNTHVLFYIIFAYNRHAIHYYKTYIYLKKSISFPYVT